MTKLNHFITKLFVDRILQKWHKLSKKFEKSIKDIYYTGNPTYNAS